MAAHGTRPADASDFDQMWGLVSQEFGIDSGDIPDWPQLSLTG